MTAETVPTGSPGQPGGEGAQPAPERDISPEILEKIHAAALAGLPTDKPTDVVPFVDVTPRLGKKAERRAKKAREQEIARQAVLHQIVHHSETTGSFRTDLYEERDVSLGPGQNKAKFVLIADTHGERTDKKANGKSTTGQKISNSLLQATVREINEWVQNQEEGNVLPFNERLTQLTSGLNRLAGLSYAVAVLVGSDVYLCEQGTTQTMIVRRDGQLIGYSNRGTVHRRQMLPTETLVIASDGFAVPSHYNCVASDATPSISPNSTSRLGQDAQIQLSLHDNQFQPLQNYICHFELPTALQLMIQRTKNTLKAIGENQRRGKTVMLPSGSIDTSPAPYSQPGDITLAFIRCGKKPETKAMGRSPLLYQQEGISPSSEQHVVHHEGDVLYIPDRAHARISIGLVTASAESAAVARQLKNLIHERMVVYYRQWRAKNSALRRDRLHDAEGVSLVIKDLLSELNQELVHNNGTAPVNPIIASGLTIIISDANDIYCLNQGQSVYQLSAEEPLDITPADEPSPQFGSREFMPRFSRIGTGAEPIIVCGAHGLELVSRSFGLIQEGKLIQNEEVYARIRDLSHRGNGAAMVTEMVEQAVQNQQALVNFVNFSYPVKKGEQQIIINSQQLRDQNPYFLVMLPSELSGEEGVSMTNPPHESILSAPNEKHDRQFATAYHVLRDATWPAFSLGPHPENVFREELENLWQNYRLEQYANLSLDGLRQLWQGVRSLLTHLDFFQPHETQKRWLQTGQKITSFFKEQSWQKTKKGLQGVGGGALKLILFAPMIAVNYLQKTSKFAQRSLRPKNTIKKESPEKIVGSLLGLIAGLAICGKDVYDHFIGDVSSADINIRHLKHLAVLAGPVLLDEIIKQYELRAERQRSLMGVSMNQEVGFFNREASAKLLNCLHSAVDTAVATCILWDMLWLTGALSTKTLQRYIHLEPISEEQKAILAHSLEIIQQKAATVRFTIPMPTNLQIEKLWQLLHK